MGHSNLSSFVVFLPSPEEESEEAFLGIVVASSPFDLKPSLIDLEANFHITMERVETDSVFSFHKGNHSTLQRNKNQYQIVQRSAKPKKTITKHEIHDRIHKDSTENIQKKATNLMKPLTELHKQ